MAKTTKPKLHKIIFLVQYKVGLNFFENLFPFAQQLTDFPNDWETDRLSVTLKDVVKHCSLNIKHNYLIYEQDSSDLSLNDKHIIKALERLPKALEIDSCYRFGYRRQYLLEVNMSFEALASVLSAKLLSQDETLRQIIPNTISDLMYRIDSTDEFFRYHFTIGPVKKEEIPGRITFNQENHLDSTKRTKSYQDIVDKYPEVAILIDIDLYRMSGLKNLSISDALPFFKKASERIDSLVVDLSSYLLRTNLT
jgi:hypothetical protein